MTRAQADVTGLDITHLSPVADSFCAMAQFDFALGQGQQRPSQTQTSLWVVEGRAQPGRRLELS